jgi:light-regulated signal transduction histidine kinase (bacteriophytochrome)
MRALAEAALAEAGTGRNPAQVAVAPMPEAWCDPVLLRQVWVNLLSNAYKYSTPRGGEARIEVGGRREGGSLHYFVRDNGVGFDMRYADKLFGVFQRLHTAEEFEGTGVGLAIVQRIIVRHGGEVGFTAAPGAGATFTFTLPDAADGDLPA